MKEGEFYPRGKIPFLLFLNLNFLVSCVLCILQLFKENSVLKINT